MTVTVATQADLDAALAAKEPSIWIKSPEGLWLTVTATGSSHVEAWESSHVEARGSSHVEAWGSSHVEAWESSHVEARESSHVEAWESSHVEARESSHVEAWESSHVEAWGSSHVEARESSHVEAWGSSHVVARGSSHVEAWGSSHVEARESSHVEARGSSHVEARGSSHVEAWESSHVVAWGSSHVVAAKLVAVHRQSTRAVITGGVIIDVAAVNLTDPTEWCDWAGAPVTGDTAVLYKALDDRFEAGQQYTLTRYEPGTEVVAADWEPTNDCGHGLHLSPTTAQATDYRRDATRWVACEVDVAGMRPILGGTAKAKVRSCRVLYEVDRYGKPVAVPKAKRARKAAAK